MDTEKRHTGACKPEVGRGCAFCNCGSEPEAKLCDGCFKLHETAWLDENPVNMPSDIVEVRFKNTRPFVLPERQQPRPQTGRHRGRRSVAGPRPSASCRSRATWWRARCARTGFNPYNGEYKKIYRKAKPYDIEKWQEAIALEHETMIASRQIAADHGPEHENRRRGVSGRQDQGHLLLHRRPSAWTSAN